jgi:hypothetical protein
VHRHPDYSWIGGTFYFFGQRLIKGCIKKTTSEQMMLTRSPVGYRFVETNVMS